LLRKTRQYFERGPPKTQKHADSLRRDETSDAYDES
jgi:hypothetical protein